MLLTSIMIKKILGPSTGEEAHPPLNTASERSGFEDDHGSIVPFFWEKKNHPFGLSYDSHEPTTG